MAGDGIELVGVDRLMAGGEQAIDPAQHAGRGDADAVGLGHGRVGVAHAGVKLGEVNVLHLDRAAAGQFVIQMLPRAAERLPRALRLGPQAFAVRAGRAGEQLLVELVAVRGDVRQQVRKRDVGVMATGAIAGGAGRHKNCAGQNGGGLEHQLLARNGRAVGGRIEAREERVERHLLQHEAAVVAAIIDVIQVPLAKVVIRALAGRVVEVVGAGIEGQFFDELRIEPGLLADVGVDFR